MQTRTVGLLIATALLVAGQTGCRNLPRGGLGRGPDVRTIAGVGNGPERFAVRDQNGNSSTISSRVDPPDGESRSDAIIGQVIDDRGTPVANARVRLAANGAPGGREVVGTTNRSGQFLLKGLKPGDDYTVIAEWDDGREFLRGRSAVSAPAEEVRIEVASVEASGRSADLSGSRSESSRTASYRQNDRELEPASRSENQRDRSESSHFDSDQSNRSTSSRGQSGWTPSDTVRRASLQPDDRESWESNQGEGSLRPPPGPLPSQEGDRGPFEIGPGRDRTFSDQLRSAIRPQTNSRNTVPQEFDPEEFPLPISTIEGDRTRSVSTTVPESPSSPRQVVREESSPSPPRAAANSLPFVQRFEPASAGNREAPDPPLLMTDAPPVIDDAQSKSRTGIENRSRERPGSIEVVPPPQVPIEPKVIRPDGPQELIPDRSGVIESDPSYPTPEILDEFEASVPVEGASRDQNNRENFESQSSKATSTQADPFQDVPTRVSEPDPELAGSSSPPLVEPDDSNADAHLAADSSASIRWADLPAPAPLERPTAEAPINRDRDRDEETTADVDGPLKRARGLFKWASRNGNEPETLGEIEPSVLIDQDRNLLQDFSLPDLNGNAFRLKESESDYVLLCFWGTWCEPCLTALPRLANLQRQFGADRLKVVSIAYQRDGEGGPRSLARVNRRLGLNYPVLLAPTDKPCPLAEAMDVQYFPTLVLLDRDGRVVHRETGATNEKLLRLDRAIAAAMDESVMTITKR